EFGVSLHRASLALPKIGADIVHTADLKDSLQRRLPYVSLTSEAARREILIAPVVLALLDYTQAQLRIEYSINVSEQLKGTLDYYLHTENSLLIIEAKNADLARGFTQLAVELIALDQWATSSEPVLYGAVSTGDVWQFGRLHREQRRVEQDLNLYRVPADLQELFQILVGLLTSQGHL
ncbi:MAG: hypothetical protein WBA99_18790, partial [Nodosilinea sp.]